MVSVNKQGIIIHSPQDFMGMRKAGLLASQILDDLVGFIKAGLSTNAINNFCHEKILQAGAIPAPLNYRGFPKSVCTSVNHVVCHGIPSDNQILQDGDIVNVDVTVIVDGWHGDTSRTYFVGKKVPLKAQKLVEATYRAMMLGIEQVKPGNRVGDIGFAIESYINKLGYGIVKDYCGHGIGKIFHTKPNILHYGSKNSGETLETGMFFTIEPMINLGGEDTILSKHDGWTVTTKDKSLSAQFEHTIGVTETGYEIFTKSAKGLDYPNLGT
jgi:methionyl aminopeptidase